MSEGANDELNPARPSIAGKLSGTDECALVCRGALAEFRDYG